jgi:hypothetical protein
MKVRRLRSNTRRVGWSRTVSGTACRPAGAPARSHSLSSWIMLVARRLLTATRSASARSADESCWGAIAACGSCLRWRNQVQRGEALGSVKNAVVAASTIVNANPGRGLEPEGAPPRFQAKHRTAPGHTSSPVAGSGAGLRADRSWRPAPRSRSSRLTTCGAPVPGPNSLMSPGVVGNAQQGLAIEAGDDLHEPVLVMTFDRALELADQGRW